MFEGDTSSGALLTVAMCVCILLEVVKDNDDKGNPA